MTSNVFPMLSASPPPMDDCPDDDDEDDEFGNFTSATIAFDSSFDSPVSVDKSKQFKPGDSGVNLTNFSEAKGINSFSNSTTPSPQEFIPNFPAEIEHTKNGFIPIKRASDIDLKNSSFPNQPYVSSHKDAHTNSSTDTEKSKNILSVNKITLNSSVSNDVEILPSTKLHESEEKLVLSSTDIDKKSKNHNIPVVQNFPSTHIPNETKNGDYESGRTLCDGDKKNFEVSCDFNLLENKKCDFQSPESMPSDSTDNAISNLNSFDNKPVHAFTGKPDNTERFSGDTFNNFDACVKNVTDIESSVKLKLTDDKPMLSEHFSSNKFNDLQGCDNKTFVQISENVEKNSMNDLQFFKTEENIDNFKDSSNLKDESLEFSNFQHITDTTGADLTFNSEFTNVHTSSTKNDTQKLSDSQNSLNLRNAQEFADFSDSTHLKHESEELAGFQDSSHLKQESEELADLQDSPHLKHESDDFADFQGFSNFKSESGGFADSQDSSTNDPDKFDNFQDLPIMQNESEEFGDFQDTSEVKNVSEDFANFSSVKDELVQFADFSNLEKGSKEFPDFQDSSGMKCKSETVKCLQFPGVQPNEIGSDCTDNARTDFDKFVNVPNLTDSDLRSVDVESNKSVEFDEFSDFKDFQELDADDEFAEFSAVPFRSNKTSDSSEFATFDEASAAIPSASSFQEFTSQKSVDALSKVINTIFPCTEEAFEECVIEELPTKILEHSNKSRRLWEKLHEVEQAPNLRFQWGISHTFQQTLQSIKIDYHSILRTSSVPIFASGLSLLEPVKGLSTSANGDSEDRKQVTKDPIPPVNFDWNSSGLTNPLECKTASTLMDLSFLSSAGTESSATSKEHSFENELLKPSPALPTPESSQTQIIEQLLSKNISSVPTTSLSHHRPPDLSSEAVRVLDQFPDLSYMQAKVLMFPISSKT